MKVCFCQFIFMALGAVCTWCAHYDCIRKTWPIIWWKENSAVLNMWFTPFHVQVILIFKVLSSYFQQTNTSSCIAMAGSTHTISNTFHTWSPYKLNGPGSNKANIWRLATEANPEESHVRLPIWGWEQQLSCHRYVVFYENQSNLV